MKNAIEVYIDSKNYNLNRKFTYLVTSEEFARLKIGMLVIVPFSKSKQLAYVVRKITIDPQKIDYDLKNIYEINQEQSLSKQQSQLLTYLMDKTLCSFIEALDIVLPRKFRGVYRDKKTIKARENILVTAYQYSYQEVEDDILKNLHMICKDQKIYLKKDLEKQLSDLNQTINEYRWRKAIKQNLLTKVEVEPSEIELFYKQDINSILTADQLTCLEQINQIDKDILLLGKTGSGKTEILKYFIDQNPNFKQILILEPNNLLALQIYERFNQEFGKQVCLYNTSQDNKTMRKNYEQIKSGQLKIVIGTKNAIFAPFKNLDLIVVDEEHEQNYFNELPNYHVHDLIRIIQSKYPVKCILMSATPSFESLARAKRNYYHLVKLPASYSQHKTQIEMLKINDYDQALSVDAIMAIKKSLEENKKIIIYHNIRAYASSIECENCLRVPICPNCQENLKYYQDNTLRCHNCNFQIAFTNHCSRCNLDNSYKMIGIGIEQVNKQLKKYFANYPIYQLDSSTNEVNRKKFLKEFAEPKGQILLGTNIILHGIDFDDIDLAIVTNIDYSIRSGSVYQEEQAYQSLIQLMGRIGKNLKSAKMLIQSKVINHQIFQFLLSDNYEMFYENQYETRKLLHKYPFQQAIKINILHQDYQLIQKQKEIYTESFKSIKNIFNFKWQMTKRKRIGKDFYYQIEMVYNITRGFNHEIIKNKIIEKKLDEVRIYYTENLINDKE